MLSFFTNHDHVQAHLSLAGDGNMKLRSEDSEQSKQNQITFLEKNGIAYENFHYAQVAHGPDVLHVTSESPHVITGVDALIATEPGVFLGLTVADCFPVLFYDDVERIVGVAHAGWRGTVKEIIIKVIDAMKSQGSQPENIFIELGPGISQANFEFHYAEMIQEFGQYSQDKYIERGSSLDKIFIDLQAILMDQVESAGVPIKNMKYCGECTFADERYFSARRHQGDSHSAMLAVIGMKY